MENDEKRTQSQSRVHPFFTRSRETNRPRRCDEQSKRARPSTTTRRSKATTHPITGVAATALDAENRAALRAVKSENVRTTTVSHYASTRACRFTPSFPPRPGRLSTQGEPQPLKRIGLLESPPIDRCAGFLARPTTDATNENARTTRDGTERNSPRRSFHRRPSASIGVVVVVVASSIHPSDPRSNPASHSIVFLESRTVTNTPTHSEGTPRRSIAPDPCRSRRVVVRFASSSSSVSRRLRRIKCARTSWRRWSASPSSARRPRRC